MAGMGLKNEPRSKESEPLRNRPRSAGTSPDAKESGGGLKALRSRRTSDESATKGEGGGLAGALQRASNPQVLRGVSLFLMLAAVYLLVAMVSYLFTWETDQDLVLKYGGGILWEKEVVVENNLGRLGAFLAHSLVYEGFGVASLALLFYVIQLSFWLGYSAAKRPKMGSVGLSLLYFIPLVSLSIGLILSYVPTGKSFTMVSGAFGHTVNAWLEDFAGKIGAGVTVGMAWLLFVVTRPSFTWPDLSHTPKTATEEEDALLEPANVKKGPRTHTVDVFNRGESSIAVSPNSASLASTDGIVVGLDDLPPWKEGDDEMTLSTVPAPEPQPTPGKHTLEIIPPPDEADLDVRPTEEPLPYAQPDLSMTSIGADGIAFEIEAPTAEDELPPTSIQPVIITATSLVEASANGLMGEDGEPLSAEDVAKLAPYDPHLDLATFLYPGDDLLLDHGSGRVTIDPEELERNKEQIVETLGHFKIEIDKIKATVGPTVTLFEIVPAAGVRISKIKNLEDDIALSLSALGIRIIAPMPGKGTIGIEVPNRTKETVSIKSMILSEKFRNAPGELPFVLGKTISNEIYVDDLARMPHLLMAGATGQGKSVGLNTILVSLLFKKHPSELKFVLVDPKKVELSLYKHIERHYLAKLPGQEEPIITDTSKVVNTLNSLCIEMDNRYDLLKDAGARNISEYNDKFKKRRLSPTHGHRFLPYIVLVVDEYADLMMTAGKQVELPIARLAQLARAIGIHLIIATQRPSVNIITGSIKTNFPTRIAFKVSSKVDSRTILDTGGAEQLIGRGDMLLSADGKITRIQCAFVDTPEVERIAEFIGNQRGYSDALLLPEYYGEGETPAEKEAFDPKLRDPMFEKAAAIVVETQSGSTSLLQRRLKLGYNRAGRLMDQLEAAGIVGPFDGQKQRQVMYTDLVSLEQFLTSLS